MKTGQTIVMTLMIILLSAIAPAWAGGDNGNKGIGNKCQGGSCGGLIKAPEIDAATGLMPLALLSGIVLLMKERGRSRRTPDSKK
jgi:hypothetical protein